MKDPIEKIKSLLFPIVATAFCIIIWDTLMDVKSDVKSLLRSDATRQEQVRNFENEIVEIKSRIGYVELRIDKVYGTKPDDDEFKPRRQ